MEDVACMDIGGLGSSQATLKDVLGHTGVEEEKLSRTGCLQSSNLSTGLQWENDTVRSISHVCVLIIAQSDTHDWPSHRDSLRQVLLSCLTEDRDPEGWPRTRSISATPLLW
jgi:hypothetical protein